MTTLKTRKVSPNQPPESDLKKAVTTQPETKQPTAKQPSAKRSASREASNTASHKQPENLPLQRLRQLRRWLGQHPKIVQLACLITLTSGTTFVLLALLFKGAWTTYPDNNLAVLRSIFLMETSRDTARTIANDDSQVVTRSFNSLDPYLSADDWSWVNRFGNTVTYTREDEHLIASCRSYSPVYMVCNLSEIP